jgi:hypothetical protein
MTQGSTGAAISWGLGPARERHDQAASGHPALAGQQPRLLGAGSLMRGGGFDDVTSLGAGRSLHTSAPRWEGTAQLKAEYVESPPKLTRFIYTFEVMVSKLFPAGFGWQYSSGIAEETFGLGDTDLGFFVVTGLGDFCGVFAGHFTYYTAKKFLYDDSIVVGEQAHVALWLASAAAASGGMWQPFVNFFQAKGVELSFNSACFATMVCCGTMFYTGLRVGRYFYGAVLTGVPPGNYANLIADAQLSVAIGGATACFVGTDVSYGDANWLRGIVGVEDGLGAVHGSILAGTSTALGFGAVQTVQNVLYPMGRCWVD